MAREELSFILKKLFSDPNGAYLAAQSAAKTKTFKPIYLALRAKGFATTEAIVIIARKLLRIAFAVWTSNKPFDPKKIGFQACKKP